MTYRKYIVLDLNMEGIQFFEKRNCDVKKLIDTKCIVIGENWNLKNAYREATGEELGIEKVWKEWRPEPNEIVKMIRILSQMTFQTDKKETKRNSIMRDLLMLL